MNRAKEARERFKAVRDQAVTSFRDRRDLETGQDLQSVYGPLLPPVLIPPGMEQYILHSYQYISFVHDFTERIFSIRSCSLS